MRQFRDRDGDVWIETTHGFIVHTDDDDPTGSGRDARPIAFVEEWWGPLAELDPQPSDSPIYVTRAELATAIEEIRVALAMNYTDAQAALTNLAERISKGAK